MNSRTRRSTFLRQLASAATGGMLGMAAAAMPAANTADSPRIVGVGSIPTSAFTAPIREPLPPAPAIEEPPAREASSTASRLRSSFVPISLPEAAPPIGESTLPQFSAQPQFGQPAAPAPVQTEPPEASPGPLLASPTISTTPLPTASMPVAAPVAASAPAMRSAPVMSSAPAMSAPATNMVGTQARPSTNEFVPIVTEGASAREAAPQTQAVSEHFSRAHSAQGGPFVPLVNAPQPSATAVNPAAMQAVVQRAMQKADQASAMAQRGMLYSARTELVQALQILAHALDAQTSTPTHAKSLAAGLTAIEEARDFAAQPLGPSEDHEVAAIAASHRTRVFQQSEGAPASPVAAQQHYLAYAQNCFVEAAGRVPAASQILYRLGRLETAMAAHDADPLALHGPQALVFHQASLATDSGNWLAANELGVLYARYGQFQEAKQLLLASVTAHPHVEGWHNLATVHRRLGEADLAQRADQERKLLASKPGGASSASGPVRWIDSQAFAATAGQDVQWPAEVAKKSR